jgi:uncharacterized protein YycO
MNFRAELLSTITPAIKWWGKQHLPFTHKLVTGKEYYDIVDRLEPGTILLSRIRGEASNLLIPGFWTHAAIYTPTKNVKMSEQVTEACGVGVREEDLVTWMTTKDYVCALEPKFVDVNKPGIMIRAAEIAVEQLGKPYDYQLDFSLSNNNAFYCSELVWWSYDKACKERDIPCPFVPMLSLGVPTITPNDISLATKHFETIWTTRT